MTHTQFNEFHLAPWVTSAEFHEMCRLFCYEQLRSGDYDVVVGIPRSGMIPAAMASLSLGVPLWTMGKHGPSPLGAGLRMQDVKADQRKVKRMLILDDSSASGAQMALAKKAMALPHLKDYDVTYAAVIVTPSGRRNVDLHHTVIELPHWFEWNFFGNTKLLRGFKVCAELEVLADEEGNLMNTVPRFSHIPTIMTALPATPHNETITRRWLTEQDITHDNLLLRPSDIALNSEEHIAWKVKQASRLGTGLFVAARANQAVRLTEHKFKTVLCPCLGKSIQKDPEN